VNEIMPRVEMAQILRSRLRADEQKSEADDGRDRLNHSLRPESHTPIAAERFLLKELLRTRLKYHE
jgi:hypothetical protein